jgi:hypothetical protein
MLGKPEDGWELFQLGSKETAYDLSYVTDVAVDWLTQAIHGLRTLDVFSVHGYCEPGRMVCTVSYWCCYVIFEEDDRSPACRDVHQLHVSMLDFCKQLYEDISANLNAWVHWDDDGEDADEAAKAALKLRDKTLREKLNELKSLIEQRQEDFEEDCCFI